MVQPKATSGCAPNTRLSVPLALKGPDPGQLYLRGRARVHAQCVQLPVYVPVCLCSHVH